MICVLGIIPPRCVAGNHPHDRLSSCQLVLLQVFAHDLRIRKSLPQDALQGITPATDCQAASGLCCRCSRMICVLGITPPRCGAGNHPRDRLANCQRAVLESLPHDGVLHLFARGRASKRTRCQLINPAERRSL